MHLNIVTTLYVVRPLDASLLPTIYENILVTTDFPPKSFLLPYIQLVTPNLLWKIRQEEVDCKLQIANCKLQIDGGREGGGIRACSGFNDCSRRWLSTCP